MDLIANQKEGNLKIHAELYDEDIYISVLTQRRIRSSKTRSNGNWRSARYMGPLSWYLQKSKKS